MKTVKLFSPTIEINYPNTKSELAIFALNAEHPSALVALNAQKLLGIFEDTNFLGDIAGSIFYPDGAPILWFAKEKTPKIPGVELWLDVLDLAIRSEKRIALIGGTEEVSEINEKKILNKISTKAKLVRTHGYKSDHDYIKFIKKYEPQVCFVAMGTPKQEKLIGLLQKEHGDCLYMGIGGSLDIFTGRLKRSPKIFLNLNLEFLYRALTQPKRIWRQKNLLKFLLYYLSKKFY